MFSPVSAQPMSTREFNDYMADQQFNYEFEQQFKKESEDKDEKAHNDASPVADSGNGASSSSLTGKVMSHGKV